MRRLVWLCLAFGVLTLVSCKDGGTSDTGADVSPTGPTEATAPTGAAEATSPTGPSGSAGATGSEPGDALVSGELPAGTYTFDGFGEPVTFTLGDGWEAFVGEPKGNETVLGAVFFLFQADHPNANVAFVQASRVLDPALAWNEAGNIVPVPDDLVAWFAEHPNHEAEEPFSTSIAGRPARAVDLLVVRRQRPGWPSCGGQCVTWIPVFAEHEGGPLTTDDFVFGGALDERDRMIVVDVGGQQLLIDIGALDVESFDAFLPLAEEVLATVVIG